MTAKLLALAILAALVPARLTPAAGVTIHVHALVLIAELAVCAALAAAAWRQVRAFRSSPYPRRRWA